MTNDSNRPAPPQTSRAQRGVALVVSMMMLVAITLIGVAVMNSSRLEWRMAANNAFQTNAYTQAELALLAGEQAIIQNTCIGGALVPNGNNCNPGNFGWPFADQFYNTDQNNPLSNSALPAGANPQAANTWAAGFGAAVPGGGRYAVVYRGCTDLGVGGVATPCNPMSAAPLSIFTYEVWAYGIDVQGAARIVQSTFVMLVNWTNGILTVGNDAPIPVGAPPFTLFRRIGYVEIN